MFTGRWEDGLDIFVTKVSPKGEVLWVRRIGGAGQDTGVKIAVDNADGKVWLCGHFASDSLIFDHGKHFLVNSARGRDVSTTDIFLAALSAATGEVVFTQDFRGVGDDEPHDIVIDSSRGILYLVGQTKSPSLSFLTEDLWVSNDDFAESFVAAFNMTSTHVIWAQLYGRGTIAGTSYDPVSQSLFLRGDFPSLGPMDGSGYANFIRVDGRDGAIEWKHAFGPGLGTHMPLYCHGCNGTIIVGSDYYTIDESSPSTMFSIKFGLDGGIVISPSDVHSQASPYVIGIYMDDQGLLYIVGQMSVGDLSINGHTASATHEYTLFLGRFDVVR